jgi:hypothetical protein
VETLYRGCIPSGRGRRCIQIAALTRLDEVEAIVRLFEGIAEREGWRPGGQLRCHVQSAVYFGVLVGGELAGGLQLVRPSAAGALPSADVWPELAPEVRPDDAHVVVMALEERARGRYGLLRLLTAEVWKYCLRTGIRRLWMEATPSTFRAYARLGWRFRAAGPEREHWGEPCVPAVADILEAAASMAESAVNSDAARSLVLGALRGLAPSNAPGGP